MAKINFGGVWEEVVTREEFPMEKALEVLKNETIAIIGYGVQGPAQALNLRDNGFNVIIGQRKGSKTWDKAVSHGWVPDKTLFDIDAAGWFFVFTFVTAHHKWSRWQHHHHRTMHVLAISKRLSHNKRVCR